MARPKAENGKGSVRQRKNGLWEVRYTVGKNESGKNITKSIYGKTEQEVQEKLAERLKEVRLKKENDKTYTVAEWAERWYRFVVCVKLKQGTARAYNYQLQKHIIPGIGEIALQNLTNEDAKRLYATVREKVSEQTAHNTYRILHSCLECAVQEKILGSNPLSKYTILK